MRSRNYYAGDYIENISCLYIFGTLIPPGIPTFLEYSNLHKLTGSGFYKFLYENERLDVKDLNVTYVILTQTEYETILKIYTREVYDEISIYYYAC